MAVRQKRRTGWDAALRARMDVMGGPPAVLVGGRVDGVRRARMGARGSEYGEEFEAAAWPGSGEQVVVK